LATMRLASRGHLGRSLLDPPSVEAIDAFAAQFGSSSSHAELTSDGSKPALRMLLVTDLEHFTRTIDELGDECGQRLIHTHNEILRAHLRAYNGREIAHTGDGFIASFEYPSNAIHCAAQIQRAFEAHNRQPTVAPLRVRMGLHAGRPMNEENRLFGSSVNAAVRVCETARGMQVVASHVVLDLLAVALFSFREIGPRELKGLSRPLTLYELDWHVGSPAELH